MGNTLSFLFVACLLSGNGDAGFASASDQTPQVQAASAAINQPNLASPVSYVDDYRKAPTDEGYAVIDSVSGLQALGQSAATTKKVAAPTSPRIAFSNDGRLIASAPQKNPFVDEEPTSATNGPAGTATAADSPAKTTVKQLPQPRGQVFQAPPTPAQTPQTPEAAIHNSAPQNRITQDANGYFTAPNGATAPAAAPAVPENNAAFAAGDLSYEPSCDAERCKAAEKLCAFRQYLGDVTYEGWFDQGASINSLSPRDRSNGPVGFCDRSNDFQLNQAYLRLKRAVDQDSGCWSVGGQIDFLYGTDQIYTSARGLETNGDLSPKWNAQQYGLSMPQMYMEVFTPWLEGMDFKLGHFYTILGYETPTAPDNFFYSHSYAMQYAEPFTHTGFIGAKKFGDFTVQAGMTRGWDNWEDNNNDFAFIGGVSWASDDQRTSLAFSFHSGREQDEPPSNTSIRNVYSIVFQQKIGQGWQYVLQHDLGTDQYAASDGTDARWYGLNQYLYYTINERWKTGIRAEWFRDEDGVRVAHATQGGDYYELTYGVNWTPTERIMVRPEVRYDWVGTPNLLPYGDGTRSSQVLVNCDLIVRF